MSLFARLWLPIVLCFSANTLLPANQEAFQSDQALQQSLESVVSDLQLSRYVESGQLSVAVMDMSQPTSVRYAALNAHKMLYAASLPKIAILFAAGIEIDRGQLQADEKLLDDMQRMIRYSDNASATRVLDAVGRDKLLQILSEPAIRLYDPDLNGGLWVGKPYSKAAAYSRDPLYGISHGATVYQVLRFFYLLEYSELFTDETRILLKSAMLDPAINHKFVAGLEKHEFEALYRKSGTWKSFHSDAVMIDTGEYRFVITALSNHPEGGHWLEELAPRLYELVVD